MLNNASTLRDLRIPPANRLEKLDRERAANTAFASMINVASALNGERKTQLQTDYDLDMASASLGTRLEREVKTYAMAVS